MNLKDVAMNIVMGMNPETFLGARRTREEEINNAQRRQLLTNQEARAAAEEGRTSERFGNEKSGWADEARLRLAQIAGLDLGNKGKQNELDVFNAEGGASGRAARTAAAERRLDAGETRADKSLSLQARQVGQGDARIGLEREQFQFGKERQASEDAWTKQARDFEKTLWPLKKKQEENQANATQDISTLNGIFRNYGQLEGDLKDKADVVATKILESIAAKDPAAAAQTEREMRAAGWKPPVQAAVPVDQPKRRAPRM